MSNSDTKSGRSLVIGMPEKMSSASDTFLERERPQGTAATSDSNDVSDALLTPEEVAARLNVTTDWVWDHSSRRSPFLPVIRIGNAKLRYRASKIEEFIAERERLSNLRRKRG